jgi:hypothetical protein
MNTREDRSEDIFLTPDTQWHYSEDPSVDIAILPFVPPRLSQYRVVAHTMLPSIDKLRELNIGIGDEVVVSGLFTRRAGRVKNLPIVRFGNIAAMPSEPLMDSETGLNFHAYLVEFRSMGGLSGSPVFAYIGPARIDPMGKPLNFAGASLHLIGVVRGHWKHDELIPIPSVFEDELRDINWGIGTVTPATELLPILYSEKFVKQREAIDRKYAQLDSPTDGFAAEHPPTFTKQDFEDALKKATRKKSDQS